MGTHLQRFTFEPGYRYTLRVSVTPRDAVPADASSLRYELVEIENRTPG